MHGVVGRRINISQGALAAFYLSLQGDGRIPDRARVVQYYLVVKRNPMGLSKLERL
jgi:hypothetical protein